MNPLHALITEDFIIAAGAVSSATALRRYLVQCKEVQDVRNALAKGLITESTIEKFTDYLMSSFIRGQQFPYELTLAAIGVVLESWRTRFAEDYLLDLARLRKISEVHIAPLVAGLCLREWHKAPKVTKKDFVPKNRCADREPVVRSLQVNVQIIKPSVKTELQAAMRFWRLKNLSK